VALSDAQLLARRRRIDVEPAACAEFRDRIDVRHVDPVRTAIERHAKRAALGDAAPADLVARLDQHEALAGRRDPAGGGDSGRAGAEASAAEPAMKLRRLSCDMVSERLTKHIAATR